jgi:hypothetical protein
MRFHNRAANCQTHTGTLRFGGKECIENPIDFVGLDADTGVPHGNQQVAVPSRNRRYRQISNGIAHGLNGIQHEVHQDLFQLHPISDYFRKVFTKFEIDRNRIAPDVAL